MRIGWGGIDAGKDNSRLGSKSLRNDCGIIEDALDSVSDLSRIKKDVQANGNYINYLQMENCIIVPTFDIEADEAAVSKLKEIFTDQAIKTIDCNEIANDGGVLN